MQNYVLHMQAQALFLWHSSYNMLFDSHSVHIPLVFRPLEISEQQII